MSLWHLFQCLETLINSLRSAILLSTCVLRGMEVWARGPAFRKFEADWLVAPAQGCLGSQLCMAAGSAGSQPVPRAPRHTGLWKD